MNTIKISKKTNQVVSTAVLDFDRIVTSGNDLCLVVESEKADGIIKGGRLYFEKFASGNTGELIKVCDENVGVKDVVVEDGYTYVYFDYLYIRPLMLSSCVDISTPNEDYKYKLSFATPHYMLPSDIDEDYKVYVIRGNNIIAYGGLAFCYPNDIVKGADIRIPETDCTKEQVTLFNYETMERNAILAETVEVVSGEDFKPEFGDRVMFSTNPYFYTDSEDIILFPPYEYLGGERVTVSKYTDFMNLGVVLEEDYDAKRMFQEYQVNDLFVNKVKASLIPDIIDLEKLKYAPAFEGSDTYFLATGLTFNLHFRTRLQKSKREPYSFDDTWHFNDATDTWNGNGVNKRVGFDELYDDADFVNSSNLIGFLGFTDDDIYNQKNRVKQSFIRLSFYDSNNPLTQNLLFYSTIFLDSGDLYGKYVKRKEWLEEEHGEQYTITNPVVWSETAKTDACSALTCQITVNDEYDMTKSGEGFNLYFFKQDAPFENEHQDIYMKVEFNHAGYGRTIPMIYWRKDEVTLSPVQLTIENYLENLYIPVRISLSDKGYVYSFPPAVQVTDEESRCNGIIWENDRLVLNLFEPMLTTKIIEEE